MTLKHYFYKLEKKIDLSAKDKIKFHLKFQSQHNVEKFSVLFAFFDQEYRPIGIANSMFVDKYYCFNGEGEQDCDMEIDNIFSNGSYTVDVGLIKIENSGTLPFVMFQNALTFNVETKKYTTDVRAQLMANWD